MIIEKSFISIELLSYLITLLYLFICIFNDWKKLITLLFKIRAQSTSSYSWWFLIELWSIILCFFFKAKVFKFLWKLYRIGPHVFLCILKNSLSPLLLLFIFHAFQFGLYGAWSLIKCGFIHHTMSMYNRVSRWPSIIKVWLKSSSWSLGLVLLERNLI